jgi:hypothetical protein
MGTPPKQDFEMLELGDNNMEICRQLCGRFESPKDYLL